MSNTTIDDAKAAFQLGMVAAYKGEAVSKAVAKSLGMPFDEIKVQKVANEFAKAREHAEDALFEEWKSRRPEASLTSTGPGAVGALVEHGVDKLRVMLYTVADLLRFDEQFGMATLSSSEFSVTTGTTAQQAAIAVLRPYFIPDGQLVITVRWLGATQDTPPALVVRLRNEPIPAEQVEWDSWQSDGNQCLMISGIAPHSFDLERAPPDLPLIRLAWDPLENRLDLHLL